MRNPFQILFSFICLFSLTSCQEWPFQNPPPCNRQTIHQVLDTIKKNYVEEIDEEPLISGALGGMLSTLDPYSLYLDKSEFKSVSDMAKGEFSGIGLVILYKKTALYVISAIENSPAQTSGLQAGDLITHINNQAIQDLTGIELNKTLKGPEGSLVKLGIQREGIEPFEISLNRQVIKDHHVTHTLKDDIGYIRLSYFNQNSTSQLKKAILQIHKTRQKSLQGIILDLRNNPGGTLNQAVSVADLFLEHGTIVQIQSRDPSLKKVYTATRKDLLKGVPMVILIDRGTASASEIVSAALQDQKRAVILGEKSFGKGAIQSLIPIPGCGGIKLTTGHFITPLGHKIQGNGIEPDIIVPAKHAYRDPRIEKALNPKAKSTDKQLTRAYDLLKGIAVLNRPKER